MIGTAYGAENERTGPALLDVRLEDGSKVRVACEPVYGEDVARAIIEAETWDELPSVEFEEWQIRGEGR